MAVRRPTRRTEPVPVQLTRFRFADELTAAEAADLRADPVTLDDVRLVAFQRWSQARADWCCPPGHGHRWCRDPDCQARQRALDDADDGHDGPRFDFTPPSRIRSK